MPPSPEEERRKPWLEITLLTAFILCLLIGLAALAAFFFYRDTAGSSLAIDPLSAFTVEQVSPSLALRELSGDPANALAYQALNAGELATAHAMALFDITTTGSARAGMTTQLARAFADAGQLAESGQVYRLAQALAILDPTVAAIERNRMLIQAAEGFLAVGEEEAARESAYQAMTMAAQLPGLVPAQRAELFNNILPVAKAVEDEQLVQTLEDLARNPFLTPVGTLLQPRLAQMAEPLPADEALTGVQTARQQAARQLADRWQFTAGEDVEPERLALEGALRAEDQARNNFLTRMLGSGLTAGQQLTLLADHRTWLAMKAKIALLGFGLSIVPEWEASSDTILQELNAITSNLDVAIDTLANMQPTPPEQTSLQAEGLRWLALQSDLGLYPGAPVSSLSQRLVAAQNALNGLGQPLALPVAHVPESVPPGFRLQRQQ